MCSFPPGNPLDIWRQWSVSSIFSFFSTEILQFLLLFLLWHSRWSLTLFGIKGKVISQAMGQNDQSDHGNRRGRIWEAPADIVKCLFFNSFNKYFTVCSWCIQEPFTEETIICVGFRVLSPGQRFRNGLYGANKDQTLDYWRKESSQRVGFSSS